LKEKCVKALWNFPTVFSDYLDIAYTCLKALVKLEVVKVYNSNDELVTDSQLKNDLIKLQQAISTS
jgi:membrane-bound inhibitor of C-type lysozyme